MNPDFLRNFSPDLQESCDHLMRQPLTNQTQSALLPNKGTLTEVAAVFFKLGCIAFGGPAAHIAMLEAEIVVKRKWMDRQHFLDGLFSRRGEHGRHSSHGIGVV